MRVTPKTIVVVTMMTVLIPAQGTPAPSPPHEIPKRDGVVVSMSRDGLGLWFYLGPQEATINLPLDEERYLYRRGDPSRPYRGRIASPEIYIGCRAPYPAGARWAHTNREKNEQGEYTPVSDLEIALHPDEVGALDPLSGPWTWAGRAIAEGGVRHEAVAIKINDHPPIAAQLDIATIAWTTPRAEHSIKLDPGTVFAALRESVERREPMRITVEGETISIQASYDMEEMGQTIESVIWHCTVRNRDQLP